MTARCEPPEGWRERDGWHWVECAGRVFPAKWHKAPPGHEPLWGALDYGTPARPQWAHSVWDWRYISPVTPPAVVQGLVEALESIERLDKQHIGQSLDAIPARMATGTFANIASAALAAYRASAGDGA